MLRTPQAVPILWVIPKDLVKIHDLRPVVDRIQKIPNCKAWLLSDGSLAIVIRDALFDRGLALNYGVYTARTNEVGHILGAVIESGTDSVVLQIPDNKYWVVMWLAPGESESVSCSYMSCKMDQWTPFAFLAAGPSIMDKRKRVFLQLFLEQWIQKRSSEPLLGEKLELGDVLFTEFERKNPDPSVLRFGVAVSCSNYSPCTWPWIDLYLETRCTLRAKLRVSFEFFNPVP